MALKPLCMLDGCQTSFLHVANAKYCCWLLWGNANVAEKWRIMKAGKSLVPFPISPPTCLLFFKFIFPRSSTSFFVCTACVVRRKLFSQPSVFAAHLRDKCCLQRWPRWKTPDHRREGWPRGTTCCFEDLNKWLLLKLVDSCQSSDDPQLRLSPQLHLGFNKQNSI